MILLATVIFFYSINNVIGSVFSVVGILREGYSSYEGLNFAIPANTARSTMESIINTCNKDNQGNYGYFVG